MEEWIQGAPEQAIETLSTFGLRVLGAIALLVAGRIAAGAARRLVRRALERGGVDATLIPFSSGFAYYTVMAVVLIGVLSLFGFETTSLVAVLGAAGLAVGLAMKDTLGHFAAGVMLLVFRPFRVGDVVEIAGDVGKVGSIAVFSTELTTGDNVRITIPNGAIYGGTIKNMTAFDQRRVDLVVGIAYADDIERALGVIRSVLQAELRVLDDPEPVVAVGDLGASSVDLVVRPWCRTEDYWPLRFDLMRTLKERLEAEGLTIPFPQSEVHVVAPSSAAA